MFLSKNLKPRNLDYKALRGFYGYVHLGGDTEDSFQPLSSEIRVLANEFKEYIYEGLVPGETSVPLPESIPVE